MAISRLLAPAQRNRALTLLLVPWMAAIPLRAARFKAGQDTSGLALPAQDSRGSGAAGQAAPASANAVTGAIIGVLLDPLDALVPRATVTLTLPDGQQREAITGTDGGFEFRDLAPGSYTVAVEAEGFASQQRTVNIEQDREQGKSEAGHAEPVPAVRLIFKLRIEVQQQQVSAEADEGPATAADRNQTALVMRGHDLDILSSNPRDLQMQLQMLANADSDSGLQTFVDGYSGGHLPPKAAIREIRINQNPFAAEYDTIGYSRVEILTQPGTDKFHGEFVMLGNNSSFNSRNPFVYVQPGYHAIYEEGNLGGPLSRKASFALNGEQQNAQGQSFINAVTLDPATLNPVNFNRALLTPLAATNIAPRVDFTTGKRHTVTARYVLDTTTYSNQVASQLQLPEQAQNSTVSEQTFQLGDTQIYGEHWANETRLQYLRDRNYQTPLSITPTTVVQGSFTSGGSNLGFVRDNQDRYELQDQVSRESGSHLIRFGLRYRYTRDANRSTGGYNGKFIFPSLKAYRITLQGLAAGLSFQQIQAQGGGASQFNLIAGRPSIVVSVSDAALYAEDEWKFRPDMSLSYGLRFETQNHIHDRADFAPRLGYAWSIPGPKGKPSIGVLRAGAGIFYNRFPSTGILTAARQNGINQQEYVVNAPAFYPDFPDPSMLGTAVAPTTYQVSPRLHSPYVVQESVSLERQFFKRLNLAVTYIHTRGIDLFLTRNINAPLPGTYDPANPASGTRPLGGSANLYEYQSEGNSGRNRLSWYGRIRTGRVTLYGRYVMSFAKANTAGLTSFPSNQYNLRADYGRAQDDQHHRFYIGGLTSLPWQFHTTPFMVFESSSPFNIVLGDDLDGDAQFNDRPAYARPGDANVAVTRYGSFNLTPAADQARIPINYFNGPRVMLLNLSVARAFALGPAQKAEPAAGKKATVERPYSLELSVESQNLLNRVNAAPPVSVLGSPLFGRSTALNQSTFGQGNGNRIIYLRATFSF